MKKTILPVQLEKKAFLITYDIFESAFYSFPKERRLAYLDNSIEIIDRIENSGIQLGKEIPHITSNSSEIVDLTRQIFTKIVSRDPFLSIISTFNRTQPQDQHVRNWIKKTFLDLT